MAVDQRFARGSREVHPKRRQFQFQVRTMNARHENKIKVVESTGTAEERGVYTVDSGNATHLADP